MDTLLPDVKQHWTGTGCCTRLGATCADGGKAGLLFPSYHATEPGSLLMLPPPPDVDPAQVAALVIVVTVLGSMRTERLYLL